MTSIKKRPIRRPMPTEFSVRLGSAVLPAYWTEYTAFPLLFRIGDVKAAFADAFEIPANRWLPAPEGYVWIKELLDVADPANIEAIAFAVDVVGNAFNWSSWRSIAVQLASETVFFEEGLRLNDLGLNEKQRHRILSAKFPGFDPRSDDIGHAAHLRLMARRKTHGLEPEYECIERQLEGHGLIVWPNGKERRPQ